MIHKIFFIIITTILLFACTRVKTEVIYESVYPTLPPLESPLILAKTACKFSLPSDKESTIFVGFDKDNYKCYLKNQEIQREQILLYEKFVDEVNLERQKWNNMNKSVDK